jgi:hypothetical protein
MTVRGKFNITLGGAMTFLGRAVIVGVVIASIGLVVHLVSSEMHLELQNREARGVMEGQCSQMKWSLDTNAYSKDNMPIYKHVYAEICKDVN